MTLMLAITGFVLAAAACWSLFRVRDTGAWESTRATITGVEPIHSITTLPPDSEPIPDVSYRVRVQYLVNGQPISSELLLDYDPDSGELPLFYSRAQPQRCTIEALSKRPAVLLAILAAGTWLLAAWRAA